MNSNGLSDDSVTGLHMDTSQQASPGPSAPSSPSPSLDDPVPERVPDSNAHYQIKCFQQYLWDLSMKSQSERESQLSSIANRIKSGYRQLPNPKHILAMIRFNDQGRMHFKFWLRMNNPWPFTGSVEEMELWHEVDALSTQLYEMVYDQAQINLKMQVEDGAENFTNAPNGQSVEDINGNRNNVGCSSNGSGSASSHVQENPQNGSNENVLNENRDDVDRSINVSAPKTSRDIASGQENPLNSLTGHDLSQNTPRTSMRPESSSSKLRNSPQIPSTSSFIKISRRSNPPKRTSPRKAISKSSIASRPSRKSDPKPPKALITKSSITSDSIAAPKSKRIHTNSTTISTPTPPTPSQPSTSTSTSTSTTTSSQPNITETPPFIKIKSKCPLHPNKICTTFQCRIGDCTKIYHDKTQLRIHQRSHAGIMPYRCTVSDCAGYAAGRKDYVRDHIQSKHYSGTKKDATFLNQFIETDMEALKCIPSMTTTNSSSSPPSKLDSPIISTTTKPSTNVSRKSRSQSPKTLISKSSKICKTLPSESSATPKSPISQTPTPTISTITPPTSPQPPTPTYPIITETEHYTKTVSLKLLPKRTSTMYQCRIGECTIMMSHFNHFKTHQRTHAGVEPFRCSVSGCSGFASVRKDYVLQHIQSVHYSESEKDDQFLNQFIKTEEKKLLSSKTTTNSGSIPTSKLNSPKISTSIKSSNISNSSKILNLRSSMASTVSVSSTPSELNSPTVSANAKSTKISKNSTFNSSITSKSSRKSVSGSPKTLIFKSKKTRPNESSISETSDSPRSLRSQVRTSTTTPTSTQPSTSSNLNIPESQSYTITNSMYQCRFGQCTVTMSNWYNFKIHQLSHTGVKPFRCSVSGCSGYAAVQKYLVRSHIQLKHYPKSKKEATFLNQFIETDQKFLNSIPSKASMKSDSRPPSKANSPKALTKMKPSNISGSSKISKMKPSIAYKTSRKSASRISKTLVSKSSRISTISKSPTTGSSTISRSRRSQTNTTVTPTPTPTQPSTSSNLNNTETQSYTIIESQSRAKMYQCRIGQCTVTMRNWYNFKLHQFGHTGVKPFRCSVSGCDGYASVQKNNVRGHIQQKHYPNSKKEATFVNQFIETDQKLLNSIPSRTSVKSDSRPPSKANSPKASTKIKSSNISKISKMKPSIAFKTSRKLSARLPKTSKSSKESSTTGSTNTSFKSKKILPSNSTISETSDSPRSRRSQTLTTTTPPPQPSTSSNLISTETPLYTLTIIKDRGDPTKSRTIFNCRIGECTKVMHDLQRFRVHQQTHTDVKPYQCSVVDCDGYASSHKSKVLHHIRLVHYPETEEETTLNRFVETDEEMLGWFA